MKKFILSTLISSALALSSAGANAIEVGDKAPDWDLTSPQGSLRLSGMKGQFVYLDFWASWCGPCRQSFPWMNAIQEKHAGKGLRVVGINLDQRSDDAKKFLAEVPAKFSLAFDPSGNSARTYGVKGMPTSILIGPDGTVLMVHQSFKESDKAELESKILRAMEKK